MKNKATQVRAGVQHSRGNVFADMGLPHANERLAKAELARQIALVIEQAGWTQVQAAQMLGIDQPKVSALLRGQLAGFSTDRMIRFLTALGQDVEIIIRPHPSRVSSSSASLRVRRVA